MKPILKNAALAALLLTSGALLAQIGRKPTANEAYWNPTRANYENEDHLSIRPAFGFVPDAKTALAIGTTILKRHFPPKDVEEAGPFSAADMGGYWVVYGRLPLGTKRDPAVGGTMIVEVDRESGAILRLIREQ